MPTIDIKHTPQEVAEMFGAMDDSAQCEFFNHLAAYVGKEYGSGSYGFMQQMEAVRQSQTGLIPSLTTNGFIMMKIIGGDY